MQPTLDPQVVNLAKAIRQTESSGNFQAVGKSGEYGAYQYTKPTWQGDATKYLGQFVPLEQATPLQQNEVAYKKIADLKAQGHNVGQIASIWNSGKPDWAGKVGVNSYGVSYNVPQYVDSVSKTYQQFKAGMNNPTVTPNASTVSESPEGYSVGGFVQNIGSSAYELAAGLGKAVLDPVGTASAVIGTVAGAVEKPFGVENADTQKFDAVMGYFKERYGGDTPSQVAHNIIKTAYNDPVGAALDLSTVFSGGAGVVGQVGKITDITNATKLAKASDFVSTASGLVASNSPEAIAALTTPGTATKVAQVLQTAADYTNVLNPVVKGVTSAVTLGASGAKTIASQMIGLAPKDIETIIANPGVTKTMWREQINRGNLADEFGNAIDDLENSKGAAGSGYESIKKAGSIVSIPERFFESVLSKSGLSLSPEGKVVANTTSVTRNTSDINAIQKFIDDWSGKPRITSHEFLNMRSDLVDLADYDKIGVGGKTKDIQTIAHSFRDEANNAMRPQIEGLKSIDEVNAPLIEQFKQAKKDFLIRTQDGYVFKDGALNKIANATGKGKNQLLERMEAISPGITKKIELVKTAENIEAAYGIKTGTYLKSMMAFSGFTGNVPAIIGSIVSHPAIAIPLLRGAGYTARTVRPITAWLRMMAGDPNLLKYAASAVVVSEEKGKKTND